MVGNRCENVFSRASIPAMLSRALAATLGAVTLSGSLLVATAPPTTATAAPAKPTRTDAGALSAIVTSPLGGDWSVRFVDSTGTVLTSVKHDAIALKTAD